MDNRPYRADEQIAYLESDLEMFYRFPSPFVLPAADDITTKLFINGLPQSVDATVTIAGDTVKVKYANAIVRGLIMPAFFELTVSGILIGRVITPRHGSRTGENGITNITVSNSGQVSLINVQGLGQMTEILAEAEAVLTQIGNMIGSTVFYLTETSGDVTLSVGGSAVVSEGTYMGYPVITLNL